MRIHCSGYCEFAVDNLDGYLLTSIKVGNNINDI